MKIEEHEHTIIYSKTNFDWNCNECKSKNQKKSQECFVQFAIIICATNVEEKKSIIK